MASTADAINQRIAAARPMVDAIMHEYGIAVSNWAAARMWWNSHLHLVKFDSRFLLTWNGK